ncbi:MAG: NapC/NirT family cytochrome c [Actinobacteria bacterium]|nr:NapC/NirT family cytochrome c [Actinomycetota bacterium]MCL5887154.1 NapC/NirT family cytochrome c [Actinomycetota bacterium]
MSPRGVCDSVGDVAPHRRLSLLTTVCTAIILSLFVFAGAAQASQHDYIELDSHEKLGSPTRDACQVCHDMVVGEASYFILIDGSQVPFIEENVPRLCYRCHSNKYNEWQAGTHGKPGRASCITCHSPHRPGRFKVAPLPPFLDEPISFRVGPYAEPFTPLPPPADDPPSPSLPELEIVAILVFLLSGGLVGISIVVGMSAKSNKGRR